ncbi:MAG: sugar phosphate nucleotidyltransferase, partial [Promethearchaeota archaeon]
IEIHDEYKGLGLIATKTVEDPSRYGVLIVDKDTNKIKQFREKEEFIYPVGKPHPMPINAGVYLLEPDVLNYIKPGKKTSIEREIFPRLTTEGHLYQYPISGIWRDIGKPEELLEGNIEFMNDLLENSKSKNKNLLDKSLDIDGKAHIYAPVAIGKNVIIRKNCKIGPNVIIGDNVYIDENTKIQDALIYNEAYISKNVNIEKAIISDKCVINNKVEMKGNNQNLVILASNAIVVENIKLIAPKNGSITVCHHEVVGEDIDLS